MKRAADYVISRPLSARSCEEAAGAAVPDGGAVYVTGASPSQHPFDRSARFTRENPDTGETYHETDLFTVMSLDLQPDADLDGAAGGDGDAPALAAEWDREWLIPANTNVWFPVKIFKDVALSGTYTLALSGSADIAARYGEVTIHGGESAAVPFPFGASQETVGIQASGHGSATLIVSFVGTGVATNYVCGTHVDITAWGVELFSAELDAGGFPVTENGRAVPAGEIGPDETLCTYVPYEGGGAPDIGSTSPRWVTFTAVTNAVTNCATLSMTQDDADGFKVWDLDFGGATTNGTFAWLWQGASNAFLRAEVPTNAPGAMMPLSLAFLDTDFNGLTNATLENYSLYFHADTNGFWGSTYSITGPREETGMPAFSDRNAFVVRVPAVFASGNPVCEISVGEDDPVEVPLAQDADGNYVSCLVVPVSELDEGADLGLEGYCDAVKISLGDNPYGTGWQRVKIDIKSLLNGNERNVASQSYYLYRGALFSALVSADAPANERASKGVTQAGGTARKRLDLGATALLSPDKQMINDLLPRHCVWVHSGHGSYVGGIQIIEQVQGGYRKAGFKASDIPRDDLEYHLVFMNTCESTDREYKTVRLGGKIVGLASAYETKAVHAVRDIGVKLNAISYVGWDCTVERQVSVNVPNMLMEELDTKIVVGEYQLRSPSEAVDAVVRQLYENDGMDRVFSRALRCLIKEGAFERVIDANKIPY